MYYYRISSRDAAGNLAVSSSNTFRTTTGSGSNTGGSPFVKKQARSLQQENMFYTIMFATFLFIAVIFYVIAKRTKKTKLKR